MTEKQRRQRKILELIASRPVGTQEALSRALAAEGIPTTQSTLSKDMRELGVVKVPDGEGAFRYQASDAFQPVVQSGDLLKRELADFVVDVDGAGNFVVVKTITGHAQGVCEAVDQAAWPEVVGTIAGENTIFILCRTLEQTEELKRRILHVREEL